MAQVIDLRRQNPWQAAMPNLLTNLILMKVSQNFQAKQAEIEANREQKRFETEQKLIDIREKTQHLRGREKRALDAVDQMKQERRLFEQAQKLTPIKIGNQTGYVTGTGKIIEPKQAASLDTWITPDKKIINLAQGMAPPQGSIPYKPQPTTNVSVSIGDKGMTKIAEKMGEGIVTEGTEVEKTAHSLQQLQTAKQLLHSGMITGFGANALVGAGKALQRGGIHLADDAIANTEAYASMMGNQVAQIIKQFGAGTGLSDADREYAEKIAGGRITLSKQSLMKIIGINEKAMTSVIENFNKKAGRIMAKPEAKTLPYDLRVKMPKIITPKKPADFSKMTDEQLRKAAGLPPL